MAGWYDSDARPSRADASENAEAAFSNLARSVYCRVERRIGYHARRRRAAKRRACRATRSAAARVHVFEDPKHNSTFALALEERYTDGRQRGQDDDERRQRVDVRRDAAPGRAVDQDGQRLRA